MAAELDGAWQHLAGILAVWTVVTAVALTLVLARVLPWLVRRSPFAYQAYRYVLGPGLIVLVGICVGWHSSRPWVVAVGTVMTLWAVVSVALGCPGIGCTVPEGYQYWRNIKMAFDVGIAGPRLLVSADPGTCAFSCPYKIQLIPLAFGYGSFALGLSSPRSPTV